VLIASGLLMFASHKRRSPAEPAEEPLGAGTVLLAMATLALFIAFFLRWSSLWVSLTRRPFLLVSKGFSGWGWMSFAHGCDARRRGVALRGRAEGWATSPKVLSIS